MARLLLIALLLITEMLPAQVVINEICAANLNLITDVDGDREDWVELFNTGATAVNIGGWFLSDNPGKPQKWIFPVGQTLPAGAYITIFCSGKDKVSAGQLHTNFKLTQTNGESVVLTQANGTLVDTYTFGIPNQLNHSYGRNPNGAGTWKIFSTPTPGANNGANAFLAYAPGVQATLDGGFYPGGIAVSLSTNAGFTIRYTTNGNEPNAGSALYSVPLNINATTVLKARAFSANTQILPGFVTANTYFINVSHTIPVISIAGNNLTNLLNGNQIRPVGSFEYYENQVLADEAYGEFNKHGNDSWAYPQRGIDWITRDQVGYKDLLKHKFFKDRDRTKFQRLILKAAANDNYPAINGAHIRDSYVHTLAIKGGLDVDSRTHESCILYVNGQYWGVYDMREKVDDADFTSYYYNQDEPDIDFIKTWGNTWLEYGTGTDWYSLKAFILGNNMTIPANYDIVKQQFDLQSLVDYIIINQHTVCKDWLNWNTAWWRGRNPNGDALRWRYTLWDMDATFGHYTNYTGIPNVTATADPCDVEQIPNNGDPQNHIDILMALFENQDFKDLYINRYADLLNTSLSCQYMNDLLDSMVNTIAPEMPQQIQRWGGNINQWNQEVQEIHDFINARCQFIDQSIVDCYDVTGPFQLTVLVSPAASPNQVMVNTIMPTSYPFMGNYFGDVNITLKALAAPGWIFDHWEVNGNAFGPDQFSQAILLAFIQSGVVTAFFVPDVPCTEPTDLLLTANTASETTISWTGPTSGVSYTVRYRNPGQQLWVEAATTLPEYQFSNLIGCSDYEIQVQAICPHDSSDFVDFAFTTPDHLVGYAVPDAVMCNSTNVSLDASFPGATYIWDDASTAATRTVSQPGSYWVSVMLGNCIITDSIVVSQINASSSIQPMLCQGETYTLAGDTFDAQNPSGQVILASAGTGGCDSLVNVNLQFLATNEDHFFGTSCDPNAAGVDSVLYQNVVGCDSLVITTTTFASFSQTQVNAATCNPSLVGVDTLLLTNNLGCDSLVITATVFDASGIPVTNLAANSCNPADVGLDTISLQSIAGCDSLVITNTSLVPFSQTQLNAGSCNPNLLGVDTLLLANYFGCDSLVITTTVFDPSGIPIINLSANSCNPADIGIDTLILQNIAGCDSVVITNTSLVSFSQTQLNASSCNPNLVGVDTLLLANYFGCDSLVITNTVFDPSGIPITNLIAHSCNPADIGLDTILLQNIAGCDSVVITTTNLVPFSQTQLNASSCNPNVLGVDTLLLANYFGCDSLVITTTTFNPTGISFTNLLANSCNPVDVGLDTLLLQNIAGCDSLVITNTSLAAFSQITINETTCNPTLVGTDTLILANHFGCDSLVIKTRAYSGLAVGASAPMEICFGAHSGLIQLDSIVTTFLPVVVELEHYPIQFYSGTALNWNNLPAGNYALTATNTEGCSTTQTVEVLEGVPLHLEFDFAPIELHWGDSVWVEPVADFQIAQAEWQPVDYVQCPTCPGTYIAPVQSGDYTLTVFDPNGCSTSATLPIKVEKGIRFYVPNAIRPGSGGPNANLSFFAGPEVLEIRSIQIFDRWGSKVFEQFGVSPNAPNTWDGTFRGSLVNPGVYIWLCEVETIDGAVEQMSGDVTVLR